MDCKIEGCRNRVRCSGYCRKHYESYLKHGCARAFVPCIEVVRYAVKANSNSCILWPFAISHGYGVIKYKYKMYFAHRLARLLFDGIENHDLFACHSCNNPLCINPNHVYWGDHYANMADMKSAKSVLGERNPKAKLTAEAVVDIRTSKKPARELAEKYGVATATIYQARNGHHWKHVGGTADE